jgi:metallo-beta-lactamase family protein
MKITFLGAVQQVTGSKYLVEHEDLKVLVDCGIFQGLEAFEDNKKALPIDVSTIHAVLITHAHIDHSGYIPVLFKRGFKGKIYCTQGTYELCKILLPDCASILEEEAENLSSGIKVLPLYTKRDALHALKFFQLVDYEKEITLGNSLKVSFHSAGHIVGASFITLFDGKDKLSFSGDLGRFHDPVMKSPILLKQTDFLVMESTYGDRLHEQSNFIEELNTIIDHTVARKGVLVISAFSVGRAQTMLYSLYQLKQKKSLPNIPIFLDSPTAIKASHVLCNFPDLINLSSSVCEAMLHVAKFTDTVQQSKKINHTTPPMIIISASGMAEGGRILHHLKHFVSDEKNTIMFVGYQAEGTRGYNLTHGVKKIQIDEEWYNVHANIKMIDSFSAHADYKEIIEWLGYIENKPKKIFITHGQPESAESLKKKIEERFGWTVVVPKYLESFDLD